MSIKLVYGTKVTLVGGTFEDVPKIKCGKDVIFVHTIAGKLDDGVVGVDPTPKLNHKFDDFRKSYHLPKPQWYLVADKKKKNE